MRRPYNHTYKIILRRVPVCCALSLGLLLASCAPQPPPALPEDAALAPVDALEPVLQEVYQLFDQGDYFTAAEKLRSVGQQEPSYHRMDEVIYWLGRCHLGLGDPVKANRAFGLLRRYYPRAGSRFPYLAELEERAAEALAALPRKEALEPPGNSGPKYAGPPVSNSFYETDIRQALMDLSAQTGIAIIPDAMVHGYVSMDLIDVPLEQALSLLLSPLGFSFRKIENYYIVGAPTADNPSFPLLAQTEEIKPRHLPAADVPKILPDYYKDFLKVNPASNTLTISAPPEIIARFKEELAAVDLQPQQIMIEALVVEMGAEARRSLGLDWDWTGTKANSTFQIAKIVPNLADTSYFFGELTRDDWPYEDITYDLRLALRALAIKDKANIRANPRIATLDGQEATIRIGKEAYYSLLQGSTIYSYVTLEKIATGITLQITPYVGSASDITADIVIEVSDVTGAGATDLPVTSVRTVQTRVQVANGQTIGIGGLVSENKRETRNRIPFLGDIPILGYFFGSTQTEKEETEVVVLITPHLLINPNEFDNL